MISSIRHAGIVVRDLDRSLAFYSGMLGLELYRRHTETAGEFIDDLVGIPGVTLEWAKLIIPSGGLIELLQYHSHPDPQGVEAPEPASSNRLGCSHVALTVDNLGELHKTLTENGYSFKSAPLTSPNGKVRIAYCHDPDGVILELIEDL
jgi:catechol 2,3-dioxygenase-like lactoylglutathione lyase family enzyme